MRETAVEIVPPLALPLNRASLAGVRCLVLGAGGFLAAALCRALCDCGAEVQGFGRAITYPEALDPRVIWMAGQFADPSALAKAVEGQDVVFHLIHGSIPVSSNIGISHDFNEITHSTLALLELCRAAGVRKVIFASSGGTVYGINDKLPIAEGAPTDPISAYGIGKLVIEKFLYLYFHLYGLNYHVLRIANPYGRYQSPLRKQGLVATLLHRALSGRPLEIWGDGEVVRDFIYVDDVAAAFIHAVLYGGEHRVMNVGSGVGLSVKAVVSDIRDLLNLRDMEIVYRAGRSADVPVNVLDTSLIQSQTPWRPMTSWPDGLVATAEWMRDTLSR